jgi:hypothetical protein
MSAISRISAVLKAGIAVWMANEESEEDRGRIMSRIERRSGTNPEEDVDLSWMTDDGKESFDSKFTSAALDVAMRWVDFGQYGSEQAACKALRRRCPRLPAQDYVGALQQAVQLLAATEHCLKPHADSLREKGMTHELEVSLANELETVCPGFMRFKYNKALFWVWYTKYRE